MSVSSDFFIPLSSITELSKHLGAAHWLASFFTTDMYTIDNLDSAIHGFKSLLGSESERHKWAKERKSKANKVQAYFAGMKESSWSNVYSMRFGQFFISLYKAAGSPHSGYTYIYRRLLYWSYTEGRGSILHRLQKTTLIEPHLQVSEISRERMGWGGNSTREEGSEGRGEMMQSESLTRLPNNLTLEKTYRFHAQCILNRSREEPFTINICIFREPTYIKKWLKKPKTIAVQSLFFFFLSPYFLLSVICKSFFCFFFVWSRGFSRPAPMWINEEKETEPSTNRPSPPRPLKSIWISIKRTNKWTEHHSQLITKKNPQTHRTARTQYFFFSFFFSFFLFFLFFLGLDHHHSS